MCVRVRVFLFPRARKRAINGSLVVLVLLVEEVTSTLSGRGYDDAPFCFFIWHIFVSPTCAKQVGQIDVSFGRPVDMACMDVRVWRAPAL